jgi:hypothetical protein
MTGDNKQIKLWENPKDDPIDQELIEESVRYINDKANETIYKGSLEIGNFILRHFFNDDIKLASSKNPRKPNSYKALCRHKDLSVPYSTLTVMVRVAAQERFLKLHDIDTERLGYTHKANLIRLRNSEKKLGLARRCIDEGLSTRKLTELVKTSRQDTLAHRKMEQEETALKNIMKIEQLLNRSEKSELVTDIDKIRSMHAGTREELRKKANELLDRMAMNTRDCKTLLKNIRKIEKEKVK